MPKRKRETPKPAKPYDVTFKHLAEVWPRDALPLIQLDLTDVEEVTLVDSDLSTVVAGVIRYAN